MVKPTVLGIVGGIGSGKSTVARLLGELGARIVDADRIAKEYLQDPEVRAEIRRTFGEAVFLEDGGVDRLRLADEVFRDRTALARLNAILHPRVRARIRERLAAMEKEGRAKLVVLDVPLLVGSELARLCHKVVAVRASEAIRGARVARDREWDPEELIRREAFQPSQAEKEATADFIIENDGSLEALKEKVQVLYQTLCGGGVSSPRREDRGRSGPGTPA